MNDKEFQTYVLHKLDNLDLRMVELIKEVVHLKTKSSLLGAAVGTFFGAFVGWAFKWWRN